MLDVFSTIKEFLNEGGNVLWLIFFVTLVLWMMIIDRFLFFKYLSSNLTQEIIDKWNQRTDKNSWFAHRIRESLIVTYQEASFEKISTIKTLVNLCPLLGLLGTVTGMISVFDVMALTGTGNARLMASGISMATIPTMAGMVAALSGLYFGTVLENKAKNFTKNLAEKLVYS